MKTMQSLSFARSEAPIELNEASRTSKAIPFQAQVGGAQLSTVLDVNKWLPAAAEQYNISPNLRDYILVPVPSIISDLPNTNGDSASREELTAFNPAQGRLAFETWIGKPTFVEHANKDHTKAKGVIIDVNLRPMTQFKGNHVRVIKLLAYDRTNDPLLCTSILNGDINTYSMGMNYICFTCSVCGHTIRSMRDRPCPHTAPRKKTYMLANMQLAFRRCIGITGFECSAVADPAYISANSDVILDVNRYIQTGDGRVVNKNNKGL